MRGKRRREPRALPIRSDPEGLAAHIVDYLESIRSRTSPSARWPRVQMLRAFASWCADRGVTRSAEVTRPILERYQRWLFHYRKADGRPLTFHTQQFVSSDPRLLQAPRAAEPDPLEPRLGPRPSSPRATASA